MLEPDYGDPTDEERSEFMDKVTSSDGTQIAFDRLGDGPPVIVVGGAMCDRALIGPTAEELAKHFTVLNYDRRGRGDSGDTGPYAVEREIEDIGALIVEAGGSASVYGHSSGAALALHAAAAGLPVKARAARAALQPRGRRGPTARDAKGSRAHPNPAGGGPPQRRGRVLLEVHRDAPGDGG